MTVVIHKVKTLFLALLACALFTSQSAMAEMVDHPVIKLQTLDKITARTLTFEARVGSTVKFGPLFIKIRACRKAPPIDTPESAAFLQIWEVTPKDESKWVFSGWMFASSPALSPMDHPIYDVWVLDCLEQKTGTADAEEEPETENIEAGKNIETDMDAEGSSSDVTTSAPSGTE